MVRLDWFMILVLHSLLETDPDRNLVTGGKTQFTFELLNILKSVNNTQLQTKERNSEYHKEQTLLVSSAILLILFQFGEKKTETRE